MDRLIRTQKIGHSRRGTFVPLVFHPGEAFQFDWSEDWATVGGKRLKLQAAHTKLSHSRAFVIRAYKLQTHEMLFDALAEAFRVLGGRCKLRLPLPHRFVAEHDAAEEEHLDQVA